jgi:four helix bundle protein
LKKRTKAFALAITKVGQSLPKNVGSDVLCKQLLRSATSAGANYRSACGSRSKADFISKITIVEEEADEAAYWLELLMESGIQDNNESRRLRIEAEELTRIFVASGKTAKRNKNNPQSQIRNPR